MTFRPAFPTRTFQHTLENHVRQYRQTTKVHKLTKGTDQLCGLQACLRHTMRLARWAGLFAVQGLGQTSADGTRFKIWTYYGCYNISTLVGQVVMACFSVVFLFDNQVDLSTVANIIFYVTGLISSILLLKLAQQWPQLMAKATEIEQGLTELKLDCGTVVQTTVTAYVVMALALIEHILCASFNTKFVMECLKETRISTNVLKTFVIQLMPFVFDYTPYNAFAAFVFECFWLQATFLWSFTDVMLTCFSIYLTAYFQKLNKIIAANIKKEEDGIPWSVLRVHYSNAVKLVREIDVQISSFILVSFFTDLFYICMQMFNSLHRNHISFKYCDEMQTKEALSSPYYLLYYLYSVSFLVLRALMLSLFASNVHWASREPKYLLNNVPSSVYDAEVRRFQLQMHNTEVGLSGKFFYVTRNTILTVMGSILTYEIVLLQCSITPEPYYKESTMIVNFTRIY